MISLADKIIIDEQPTVAKKKAARKAQSLRGEYSSRLLPAEEQLPPKGYPECLVLPGYLNKINEITKNLIGLSKTPVDIKSAVTALNKKVSVEAMDITP